MIRRGRELDERVLVVAPRGRDGLLLAEALRKARCRPEVLGSVRELLAELDRGAGILLVEEEALDREAASGLLGALARQPAWSDLPVVVLTSPDRIERQTREMVRSLGREANVVLLERPIRMLTLVQAVESELRARRRQYEVRDFQETLESRVAERTAQLEASLKEMDTFSYTIAHDLRAPLRALHGFSDLLLRDYLERLDEEGRDYLSRIRDAAHRMDALIIDLLNYSRLGQEEVPREKIDIHRLATSTLEHMVDQFRQRRAEVTLQGPAVSVMGNAVLLEQALTNLLSNAVKFVAHAVTPRVQVVIEPRPGRVRVKIVDNGIGIAAEHHERIFGVFQQLNLREDYPGTGIGLALFRRAVEKMGGTPGVESAPGTGSTFWFELDAA